LVGILVTGNLNSYDETRDNKLQQVWVEATLVL
jgi:hypothetical protein